MSRERTLELLGLPADATPDAIKARYRELARKFHPDVNRDDDRAHARFRAIVAAYQELLAAPAEAVQLLIRKRSVSKERPAVVFPVQPAPLPPIVSAPRTKTPLVVTVEVMLEQVIGGGQLGIGLPDGTMALVELPPGADTGTLLRPSDRSDVIVEVRVAADPKFRRQGNDLITTVSIKMADAERGMRFELATPSGVVVVVVPRRSKHGDVVRIVARGVPGDRGRGDLFVELGR